MQREELEKQAKAKIVTALRPYIPMALEILGDIKEHHHFQVSDVVEITDRLAKVLKRTGVAEDQPKQGEVPAKPSVTNEFLDDLITPWIQDIRQEIFNTRTLPFNTYAQAVKWLREGKIDWDFYDNERMREKRSKFPWMKSIYVVKEYPSHYSPYTLCFYRAKEVAKATGFDYIDVLWRIVTGVPVPLTLDKVDTKAKKEIHKLPSGEKLVNRFVTVQIRGELSFDELRKLYQQIRQDLGVKRSKALNEKHLKLYQLVRERGGPVKGKGSVKFWKEVMEDWNNSECKNWKGAKIAYVRLIKKLTGEYLRRK